MKTAEDNIYEGAHIYGFRVVPGRFLDKLCEIEGIELRLEIGRGVKHIPV